jgi:translation initiation factor 1A
MVKNAGGNKSKRQGRKFSAPPPKRNLRLIWEEGEQYAVVTKLFGGANCQVMCMDGIERLCIIRNKFRGRHKRDNQIGVNTWVLVGVRDWEARAADKTPRSDLLEVYSLIEKEKLKDLVSFDLSALIACDELDVSKENDVVEFIETDSGDASASEMATLPTTDNIEDEYDVIDVDEI